MTTIRNLMMLAVMTGALSACGGGVAVAYRVPAPPPRPMTYGVVGMAPGPGYVWVDGYHDWRSSRYVWVPGAWHRPPHPRAVWVPGYFQRHGHSHVWVGGRWRY